MNTKNITELREEVQQHLNNHSFIQGHYWNRRTRKGGFIGCLSSKFSRPFDNISNNMLSIENRYGIPVMVLDLVETIYDRLPSSESAQFVLSIATAISNGINLTQIGLRFISAELKALLSEQSDTEIAVKPIIEYIDRMVAGQLIDIAVLKAAASAAFVFRSNTDASVAAGWAASAIARDLSGIHLYVPASVTAAGMMRLAVKSVINAACQQVDSIYNSGDDPFHTSWSNITELVVKRNPDVVAAVTARQRDTLLRLIAAA